MKTHVLRVSKERIERGIGECSIQGALLKIGALVNKEEPIRIEFEEFSLAQCKDNNGPGEIIVSDFVFGCLCRSIHELTKQGYKLEIGSYHNE